MNSPATDNFNELGRDLAEAMAKTLRFGPRAISEDVHHWLAEIARCDPSREWYVRFDMIRGQPVGKLVGRPKDVPTLEAYEVTT